MKGTTVDSLLIARALLEKANDCCRSNDKHLASAGLVLSQDALEIVFYALLIEIDADESKSLEGKSFDELIGELKKAGVPVPKSGTLKALNKQRLLIKHYAQLAEPVTVRRYFDAAERALESVVSKVVGRPLRELYLADFLKDGASKEHLMRAEALIGGGDFFQALVETRKAIFLEFEKPYSIDGWKEHEGAVETNSLLAWSKGGWKAHYWKKNKTWIEQNVKDPTDYVQIDLEQWRVDALEYGIHTAELANLQRLTPSVFSAGKDSPWAIKHGASFKQQMATEENARYCLDRAIAVILKKQEHGASHRQGNTYGPLPVPEEFRGCPLYSKAISTSEVVHIVNDDFTYEIVEFAKGFDGVESFVRVLGSSKEKSDKGWPSKWVGGYLQVAADEANKESSDPATDEPKGR